MNSVTIQEAHVADIPTLMDFQMSMAMETENVALEASVLAAGLRHLFERPENGQYFVAKADQQIVGCLMLTYEWSEWRNGLVLWIQSVYVARAFRGTGVFQGLYRHIQSIAQQRQDVRGIRLYVDKSNSQAQKVYQQLGMNGDHYQVFEWMK